MSDQPSLPMHVHPGALFTIEQLVAYYGLNEQEEGAIAAALQGKAASIVNDEIVYYRFVDIERVLRSVLAK